MTANTLDPKSAAGKNDIPPGEYQSSLTILSLPIFLFGILLGIVAAMVILPYWLPNIAQSFTGASPKAFWYMSRGTGFVGLGLLWGSMMLGTGITNKMARLWPGAPTAFAIHEYLSLLGLVFALFHALILLGDQYSQYQLVQLLMPFGSVQYRPFWVGLGQLTFYAWIIVAFTFYIRNQIGPKTWRVIHYGSFICYLGALIHGLMSGTDVGANWAQYFYWITGGSFLFLLIYRILASKKTEPASRPKPESTQP